MSNKDSKKEFETKNYGTLTTSEKGVLRKKLVDRFGRKEVCGGALRGSRELSGDRLGNPHEK